jgi:hypothetical protein
MKYSLPSFERHRKDCINAALIQPLPYSTAVRRFRHSSPSHTPFDPYLTAKASARMHREEANF